MKVVSDVLCEAGQYFTFGEEEMKSLLMRLWKEENGQDLVEYGLLIVLVALVAVASMKVLSSSISAAFTNAASALTSATGG